MTSSGPLPIPPSLRLNAVRVWGETGQAWLEELPRVVAECADRWSLQVGPPFPLTFHWVAPARTASGHDVVLKVGVPRSDLGREGAVLGRWAGRGAVRLLADDPPRGALLLERAVPGTPAAELVPSDDGRATRAVLQAARELHHADPDGLDLRDIASERDSLEAHLATWAARDPLPRGAVAQAVELLAALTASRSREVLLHGDLHHDNVLRHDDADGGWVAIDPHGWRGDPGFEVGPLLHNPLATDPDLLVRLLPARLELAVELLDEPLDRLRAWGFVAAVVSQVWSCEDGGAPEPAPAAVLEALRPRG